MVSINGLELSEEKLLAVTKNIKSKKELSPIDDSFIREMALNLLLSNQKLVVLVIEREIKQLTRAALYKEFVKDVRSRLRKLYGVFQKGKESDKIEALIAIRHAVEEKKTLEETKEAHSKVLGFHLSSLERIKFYEELYPKIWEITGKPSSILDLGCGFNPFSLPWMDLKKLKYYGSELSSEDCKFINEYFEIITPLGIDGHAFPLDLRKIELNPNLLDFFPEVDVCFMFKLFDSLKVATKSKDIDEKLMDSVKANYLIVSFPTQTIGAHTMNVDKRNWLEKMCDRKQWHFDKFEVENELFYIIKKL